MTKTIIKTAAAYAVTVTICLAIVDLFRKGEPRIIPAVVGGLASGVAIAALLHWNSERGTK